jgi:hypothetical protein
MTKVEARQLQTSCFSQDAVAEDEALCFRSFLLLAGNEATGKRNENSSGAM